MLIHANTVGYYIHFNKMQNSCVWGHEATKPHTLSVPRKIPEEVKPPCIRSRWTSKFTDKDMEFFQTETSHDYKPFIELPARKRDKRATCIRNGSEEYQTLHKV